MKPGVPTDGMIATLSTRPGKPVWIEVGKLFDGTTVFGPTQIVYDGHQLLHVGPDLPPAGMVREDQGSPDIVLPHHTALPGLIDAHAHLFLEGGEENPGNRAEYMKLSNEALLERAEMRLDRLVKLGVVAVRDAGDRNGVGLALQRRFRSAGRGTMPYVDSPGPALYHQGRYGSFMGEPIEVHGSIEAAVAARVSAGAHRIKLIATGIINFEKGTVVAKPQLPAEELRQAVAAARRNRRQTFAHCSGHEGVSNCLEAGVDSIEHGFFADSEQLARMRDLDIAWVPTFAPVQFQLDRAAGLGWSDAVRTNLERILTGHAENLQTAARLGVRIVAGSDAGSHGVAHGHGFLWELELMERAGLSVTEVLRSATAAGAERLDYSEPFGRIRAGEKARFILTEAPIFESVRHLQRARIVVFDGIVHTGGDDRRRSGM